MLLSCRCMGRDISALPTCFEAGIFSLPSCAGAAQLVCESLSQGTVLCVAVDLVCLRELVTSGASYVALMDQNSVCTTFIGQRDQCAPESLLPMALWSVL